MTPAPPLKICFVMFYFYPNPAGGSERFRRYIPKLKARGLEIQVLTVQRDGLPAEEVVDGQIITRLPVTAETTEVFLQAVWDYFEAANDWPDVIQLIVSYTFRLFPILRKFQRRGITLISAYTIIGNQRAKLHTLLRLNAIYFLANQRVSAFLCGSQVMAQSLRALRVSPKKIKIIPHGVDLTRFHPPASAVEQQTIRQQLDLPLAGRLLLFVGLLHPRKGVHLLLDAFLGLAEQYPDLGLVLVGSKWEQDPDSARFGADLIQKASDSPFHERIRLVGHVPNVEVQKMMR